MGQQLVRLNNISKAFIGVQALKDIDLSINEGEIRCLVGENGSGKSTLVKTIAGVNKPDTGEIVLNGNSYQYLTPREAIEEGVQVIYQDLSLFPHMSVAENIAINKFMYYNKKFVNWEEVYEIAREQLDKIGVKIDLKAPVEKMSIGNRQITAICRALALEAKILFMDEPTTALTAQEVDRLLSIVTELKNKGIAIVFISHKLDEVLEVADVITILRDGKKVGDFTGTEVDQRDISRYMTGKNIEYPKYSRKNTDDAPLIEVRNLTKKGHYEDISFTVRKGDIFGLAGLLGSGRTELALSLFGLNPPEAGEIYFEGQRVEISSPLKAKELGIGLLPKDRYTQGLFLEKDVKQNISSGMLDRITGFGNYIDLRKEEKIAPDNVNILNIRTPSVETIIKTLSGGNQQKTVIGKWVATDPKLFILNSPTVGIDVGAKAEIYERIQGFAGEGMAVIYISDEIDQIVNNCNRVLVMAGGKAVSIIEEDEMDSDSVAGEIKSLINKNIDNENIML